MTKKTKIMIGVGAAAALVLVWRARQSSALASATSGTITPYVASGNLAAALSTKTNVVHLSGLVEDEAGFRRYR